MLVAIVVVRRAAFEVVFGGSVQTQRNGGWHSAIARLDQTSARPCVFLDASFNVAPVAVFDQVGFVDDDQVSAAQLLFEQLFERGLVVQRFIRFPSGLNRYWVRREQTVGHSAAINHRHNTIDRHARTESRPINRFDQGLRQGQTAGFDHDMLGRIVPVEQGFHSRDKVVGNRAAQAAVGQLHDVIVAAAFDPAAAQDLTVHAHVAKLVDDQRNATAAGVLQPMADEAGFASAQKAGHDGNGNLLCHVL